jgi:NAD(P)-dependent dehydrogenase (short-subunit alcohol dehydrogenase family)
MISEGLENKRVLVTGGSRGIGLAAVHRFASAGAGVIVASRNPPPDDTPGTYLPADVGTPEGVRDLARRVLESTGGVDVLVNNAGAGTAPVELLQRSDESWLTELNVNLLSAVRLDRELVPGMVERGAGVVIHVSSIAGKRTQPIQAGYSAAKAALNSYSRGLADEVSSHGVRVLCVLPGFVATPGAVVQHRRMADQHGITLEEMQRKLATDLRVPMGRPGTPEDAAELIVFLASDRARWLTGAQYRVDGGILAEV